MKPDQRVLARIPIHELWDDQGVIPGARICDIDQNLIRELLRVGPVRFVVADAGLPLNWVPLEESFEFWKTIQAQLAAAEQQIRLPDFPDEVAYRASQWPGRKGESVILLENITDESSADQIPRIKSSARA